MKQEVFHLFNTFLQQHHNNSPFIYKVVSTTDQSTGKVETHGRKWQHILTAMQSI